MSKKEPDVKDKNTIGIAAENQTPEASSESQGKQSSADDKPAVAKKTKVAKGEGLVDVDEIIKSKKLAAWIGAALCRAEGWAPGKQVTLEEFDKALARFDKRPIGG